MSNLIYSTGISNVQFSALHRHQHFSSWQASQKWMSSKLIHLTGINNLHITTNHITTTQRNQQSPHYYKLHYYNPEESTGSKLRYPTWLRSASLNSRFIQSFVKGHRVFRYERTKSRRLLVVHCVRLGISPRIIRAVSFSCPSLCSSGNFPAGSVDHVHRGKPAVQESRCLSRGSVPSVS